MLNYSIKTTGGTWSTLSAFSNALQAALRTGLTDDWTVLVEPGMVLGDEGSPCLYNNADPESDARWNNYVITLKTDPSGASNPATIKQNIAVFSAANFTSSARSGDAIFSYAGFVFENLNLTISRFAGQVFGTGRLDVVVRNCNIYNTSLTNFLVSEGSCKPYFTLMNCNLFVAYTSTNPFTLNSDYPFAHKFYNMLIAVYTDTAATIELASYGADCKNVVAWNYGSGGIIWGGGNAPVNPYTGDPKLASNVIQSASDTLSAMLARSADFTDNSSSLYQTGYDSSPLGVITDIVGATRILPYSIGAYAGPSAPSGPMTTDEFIAAVKSGSPIQVYTATPIEMTIGGIPLSVGSMDLGKYFTARQISKCRQLRAYIEAGEIEATPGETSLAK